MKFIFICLALFSASAFANDYYVNSLTGSDAYNGTSATYTSGTTGPWLTPHCSSLQAGDIEHFAVTGKDYTTGIFCSGKAASSGLPFSPITFKGDLDSGKSLPRISVTSGQALQFRDNIAYVEVYNLEFKNTATEGAGVLIGSSGYAGTVHHIYIHDTRVIYAGGDCYNSEFASYTTFANNQAIHCSKLSVAASGSAFSILAPTVYSGDDGLNDGCYGLPYDMSINYGFNFAECIVRNKCNDVYKGIVASDGNCYIVDDGNCSQFPSTNCTGVSYPKAFLVAENRCLTADGRCVHIFSTSTTIGTTRVSRNASYNMCQGGAPCGSTSGDIDILGKVGYPNIGSYKIDHNILYGIGNHYAVDVSVANGSTVIVCKNNFYNFANNSVHSDGSATLVSSTDNVTTNPGFVFLSTDITKADLRQSASTIDGTSC